MIPIEQQRAYCPKCDGWIGAKKVTDDWYDMWIAHMEQYHSEYVQEGPMNSRAMVERVFDIWVKENPGFVRYFKVKES